MNNKYLQEQINILQEQNLLFKNAIDELLSPTEKLAFDDIFEYITYEFDEEILDN